MKKPRGGKHFCIRDMYKSIEGVGLCSAAQANQAVRYMRTRLEFLAWFWHPTTGPELLQHLVHCHSACQDLRHTRGTCSLRTTTTRRQEVSVIAQRRSPSLWCVPFAEHDPRGTKRQVVQMSNFEEGSGRIMYEVGSLECDILFLGPHFKFVTLHSVIHLGDNC